MKAFAIRHQAAGICTEWMFAERPTSAQLDAVDAVLAQRHGTSHPKTGEPYWTVVVEFDLLGPTATIDVPQPAPAPRLPEFVVSGRGTVG
jgi:hypothetical protein